MSLGIYLVGVVILIGGLIYGSVLLGIPGEWIAVGAVVMLGVSVMTAVRSTRQKDEAG